MIYKNCIDHCFDVVKACDRFCGEACETGKECKHCHCHALICADVCNMVGRLTAKGVCTKEMYELCAKVCEGCKGKCDDVDHKYAKECLEACKKCAESCKECAADCKESCETKCEKEEK